MNGLGDRAGGAFSRKPQPTLFPHRAPIPDDAEIQTGLKLGVSLWLLGFCRRSRESDCEQERGIVKCDDFVDHSLADDEQIPGVEVVCVGLHNAQPTSHDLNAGVPVRAVRVHAGTAPERR
jgi:hypothetical protein